MKEQEIQEKIAQYLRDEMAEADRAAFRQAADQSPALAQELALQQQVFRELGDRPKQQFVADLEALSGEFFDPLPPPGKPSGGRYGLPLLLAGLLAAGLVWYFWPKPPAPLTATMPETTPVAPISAAATNPVASPAPLPSNASADAPTAPVSTTNQTAAPKTAAPPAASTDSAKPQMDAAAFAPNPSWEKLATQNLLEPGQKIRAKTKFSAGKTVAFDLVVEWPAGEMPDPMVVFFYSNKEEDRAAGKFLKRVPLDLMQQSSGDSDGSGPQKYTLNYSAGIDWPPGLYYYVIARERDAKPVFVGKVR